MSSLSSGRNGSDSLGADLAEHNRLSRINAAHKSTRVLSCYY